MIGRERMRRRELLTLGAAATAWPLAVRAQQPGRTYRLAYLAIAGRDDIDARPVFDAFFMTLREHGFVEGKNLEVALRASDGWADRFDAFAAELVALKPDVIVAVGSAATLAAKRATKTIPIVFGAVPNPERLGVVESLARPGGNATGFSTVLGDTGPKLLEIMKEAIPTRRRVAYMANPNNPGSASLLRNWPGQAQSLDLVPISAVIRGVAEVERAFEGLVKERAEVLYPAPALWGLRKPILAFAAKHRLPVVFSFREWVAHGALLSYGPDLRDNFRQVAVYVAKILKGANASELPVQQPTKLELVINMKTAKALGITIPQSLLIRADEVIE